MAELCSCRITTEKVASAAAVCFAWQRVSGQRAGVLALSRRLDTERDGLGGQQTEVHGKLDGINSCLWIILNSVIIKLSTPAPKKNAFKCIPWRTVHLGFVSTMLSHKNVKRSGLKSDYK